MAVRRHPAFVIALGLVLAWGTFVIGYCVWLMTQTPPIPTDYWSMILTVLLYAALTAFLFGKGLGQSIWWKVVFVALCFEFLNWNFLLPYLGVARLGSTDYSVASVLVDFVSSLPALLFLYIYAFRSEYIWKKLGAGEDS